MYIFLPQQFLFFVFLSFKNSRNLALFDLTIINVIYRGLQLYSLKICSMYKVLKRTATVIIITGFWRNTSQEPSHSFLSVQEYNANNLKTNSTLSKIGEKRSASVTGINYLLKNVLKTNKFKMHSLRYYRLHNVAKYHLIYLSKLPQLQWGRLVNCLKYTLFLMVDNKLLSILYIFLC